MNALHSQSQSSPAYLAFQCLCLITFMTASSLVLAKVVSSMNIRWHHPSAFFALAPSSAFLLANLWSHLCRMAMEPSKSSTAHSMLPDAAAAVDYACLDIGLILAGTISLVHGRNALDRHFIASKAKSTSAREPHASKGCWDDVCEFVLLSLLNWLPWNVFQLNRFPSSPLNYALISKKFCSLPSILLIRH